MMQRLIFIKLLFFTLLANAQVGIGTTNPNNNSILDIVSTDKGILIPRIVLNNAKTAAPLSAPITNGVLIYSEGGNEPDGFYFWSTNKWISINKGVKNKYTPTSVVAGSTVAGNIPANTDKFHTYDGGWVSLVTLPNKNSSNAANRLNDIITIQKRSTYKVTISSINTDLSSNLEITGSGTKSAIFLFDGNKWIYIKTSIN